MGEERMFEGERHDHEEEMRRALLRQRAPPIVSVLVTNHCCSVCSVNEITSHYTRMISHLHPLQALYQICRPVFRSLYGPTTVLCNVSTELCSELFTTRLALLPYVTYISVMLITNLKK